MVEDRNFARAGPPRAAKRDSKRWLGCSKSVVLESAVVRSINKRIMRDCNDPRRYDFDPGLFHLMASRKAFDQL